MSVHPGPPPTTVVVEWRAHIRGRVVTCRWTGDEFVGDPEILERLGRVAGRPPRAATLDEARTLIRCTLLEPEELPNSEHEEDP
jgi:hypothetical protein